MLIMDSLSEGKTCDDTIMYYCIKCPMNKKGNINISVIWNTSRKKHRNKEIAYNLLYTDAIQRKKKDEVRSSGHDTIRPYYHVFNNKEQNDNL